MPFAVDNPGTLNTPAPAFEQKIRDRLAGDLHIHTMQIQFGVYHEHTAPESLQSSLLQAGTDKNEFLSRLHVGGLKMLG